MNELLLNGINSLLLPKLWFQVQVSFMYIQSYTDHIIPLLIVNHILFYFFGIFGRK